MADYGKLTVVKLKDILKERGLPLTGLKAALVSRLNEDDEKARTDGAETRSDVVEKEETQAQPAKVVEVTVSDVATPKDREREASPGTTPMASESTRESDILPDAPARIQSPNAAPATDASKPDETPAETTKETDAGDQMDTAPVEESTVSAAPITTPGVSQDITQQESEDTAIPFSHVTTQQTQFEPATEYSQRPHPLQTMTQSSVDPMELVEDSRKRKRRSETPPPSSIDVAAKKAKVLDGSPRVVMKEDFQTQEFRDQTQELGDQTQELGDQAPAAQELAGVESVRGEDATQEVGSPKETGQDTVSRKITMGTTKEAPVNEEAQVQDDGRQSQEEVAKQEAAAETESALHHVEDQKESGEDASLHKTDTTELLQSTSKPSPTGAKFKSLFAPAPATPPNPMVNEETMDERDIAPAQHPATTALYIRNFKRPLPPPGLKNKLKSLAQAPNDPENPETLVEFFLDSIKSHCLVQFTSVAAASRVRMALHDRVWPDERDRKALWVDYIPEEKIKKWIEVEQEASGKRGGGQKRWEVVYEKEGNDIAAYLQEEDPSGPRGPLPVSRPDVTRNGYPVLPATQAKPIAVAPPPKPEMGKGFKALDDLFHSTTTKPKLYYQPVDETTASKRLDKLVEGRGHGRGDEMRRFTFEEGMVVDGGPEFGPGWRGGGRGFRGGFGRAGYPSRGGFRGDSWRDGR